MLLLIFSLRFGLAEEPLAFSPRGDHANFAGVAYLDLDQLLTIQTNSSHPSYKNVLAVEQAGGSGHSWTGDADYPWKKGLSNNSQKISDDHKYGQRFSYKFDQIGRWSWCLGATDGNKTQPSCKYFNKLHDWRYYSDDPGCICLNWEIQTFDQCIAECKKNPQRSLTEFSVNCTNLGACVYTPLHAANPANNVKPGSNLEAPAPQPAKKKRHKGAKWFFGLVFFFGSLFLCHYYCVQGRPCPHWCPLHSCLDAQEGFQNWYGWFMNRNIDVGLEDTDQGKHALYRPPMSGDTDAGYENML